MVSCSVIDCSVTYNNNPNRETFHRFPVCARLREDWILKLNRKYWEPVKSSMVCSRHFKDSCFVQRNQRRLIKKGSIPTEFISEPRKKQFRSENNQDSGTSSNIDYAEHNKVKKQLAHYQMLAAKRGRKLKILQRKYTMV